ncbi:hypothetical protein BH09PLA1_BH09PLA1_12790 [soil metagenome]
MKKERTELMSKRWRNLSTAQKEFLRELQGKPSTLAQLQKRLNIPAIQMGVWLRSKKFSVALRSSVRDIRRRRDLSLELAALCASEKIGSLIFSRKSHISRQTCVQTITIVQKTEATERRADGAATARDGSPEAGRRLLEALDASMPERPRNMDPAEAERLLSELERSDEASPGQQEDAV